MYAPEIGFYAGLVTLGSIVIFLRAQGDLAAAALLCQRIFGTISGFAMGLDAASQVSARTVIPPEDPHAASLWRPERIGGYLLFFANTVVTIREFGIS